MPSLGVNVAILENERVLLTLREDFEVWCLPGGAVDEGESLAQAAKREAREETGLEVALTRLVGVYSRPQWPDDGTHIVLFAGEPAGGALHSQPGEVLRQRYFGREELADLALIYDHRRRILDALDGSGGGVAWLQDMPWPFDPSLDRQQLYELRDSTGLSRREFYLKYFGPYSPDMESLEVGVSNSLPEGKPDTQ